METSILTLEELKKISKYTAGLYEFDLSSIFVDYWRPLQNTLVKLGISQLQGIGFNFDTLVRVKAEAKRQKSLSGPSKNKITHPPIEFEGSIQQNTKDLIPDLIGLLSRFVPRSKSIKTLKFANISLGISEIEILSQSIQQCSSLRVVNFTNVPLYDNGFAKLCQALNHQSVQELTCKNCGLSDAIAPVILNLAEVHSRIQKVAEKHAEQNNVKDLGIVCLHTINLGENNFTSDFIEEIQDGVDLSPIISFDVTGNSNIDPSVIHSPKFVVDGISKADLTPLQYEKELMKENERLKRVVSRLVDGQDICALRSDLYAIGPRAGELSEFIKVLDEMCAEMGNNESYVPAKRSKPPKKKQPSSKSRLYPK